MQKIKTAVARIILDKIPFIRASHAARIRAATESGAVAESKRLHDQLEKDKVAMAIEFNQAMIKMQEQAVALHKILVDCVNVHTQALAQSGNSPDRVRIVLEVSEHMLRHAKDDTAIGALLFQRVAHAVALQLHEAIDKITSSRILHPGTGALTIQPIQPIKA